MFFVCNYCQKLKEFRFVKWRTSKHKVGKRVFNFFSSTTARKDIKIIQIKDITYKHREYVSLQLLEEENILKNIVLQDVSNMQLFIAGQS